MLRPKNGFLIEKRVKANLNLKTLTTFQELLENLSCRLLPRIIFLSFLGQSIVPCLKMVKLQLVEYPWKPNFSNQTKLKQKNIYIPRSIAKTQLEAAM